MFQIASAGEDSGVGLIAAGHIWQVIRGYGIVFYSKVA